MQVPIFLNDSQISTHVTSSQTLTPGLLSLHDTPAALPTGAFIVEAFAPWCMFCATTAKWDDAQDSVWAHTYHLPFLMTDVSPDRGIGIAANAPTLASIRSTAHDGSMVPLSTNEAIANNLKRFVEFYHLTVPIYFWTHGAPPRSWNIESIPTFLYFNSHHKVIGRLVGYQSTAQFRVWANKVYDKSS
jgi:hypothetical protein